MLDFELGAVQERFADLVWENEPIASGELVRLCEQKLSWKKPTTYTVLRKLCEKDLLRNDDGVVTSCVSQKAYYAEKSGQVVADSFHGSLPAFIAAFAESRTLSEKEIDEIQRMIDRFKEGK